MPFGSNRHSHPQDANAATTGGSRVTGEKRGRHALFGSHDKHALSTRHLHQRPTFGQWLKATALDIFTMIILGAIGLGVYMAPPAPSRSFPIYFNDGDIVYPQFAYPLRNEIIPIWLSALISAVCAPLPASQATRLLAKYAKLIPIFIFLVFQFRIRSFWDVNAAVSITSGAFQIPECLYFAITEAELCVILDTWTSLFADYRCRFPSNAQVAYRRLKVSFFGYCN